MIDKNGKMIDGDQVTRWAVWVSVLAFVAAAALMMRRGKFASSDPRVRAIWTISFVALVVHVLIAFKTYHGWSHAAAVAHTAAKTEAVVGISFGGGIWFNYLLLAVWGGDIVWWWSRPISYAARAEWQNAAIYGYVAFIMLNAVVFFETGPLRWWGVAATVFLTMLWLCQRRMPGVTEGGGMAGIRLFRRPRDPRETAGLVDSHSASCRGQSVRRIREPTAA